MAIRFTANSAWNLNPISMDSIRGKVNIGRMRRMISE